MKNRLRILRATHDLTQQDLADKAQVSRQTINSIETGRFIPSTLLALKIAKIFGVSVHEIFELEPDD